MEEKRIVHKKNKRINRGLAKRNKKKKTIKEKINQLLPNKYIVATGPSKVNNKIKQKLSLNLGGPLNQNWLFGKNYNNNNSY